MLKTGPLFVAAFVTALFAACSYYVPITQAPSVETFQQTGTSSVLVTQLRNTGAVGWHVRDARMDSSGLHGTFYPMPPELADQAHHLRKAKDANQLGKAVMLRLHPGFDAAFKTGAQALIPASAIAELVYTEKDRGKSGTRTVALVGTGLLVTGGLLLAVLAVGFALSFSAPL